jgi:hypothetical protein
MTKTPALTSVGEDVEKLEPLRVAAENVKMLQPPWETVWQLLKD